MSHLFQPRGSSTDTLDGIGRAFFAALDRDGGPAVDVVAAAVALLLFVLLVRWVRREATREQREREELEARRLAAAATLHAGKRAWVRVPVRVPMTVERREAGDRVSYEKCETQDISGGGGSFLCHRPPPPGAPLHFMLEPAGERPLPLRGIVVRVEPPSAPGAPSLVGVKLGPITERDREQVVRWLTHEQASGLAQSQRGHVCAACQRPLADAAAGTHPACARRDSKRPRGRAA